MSNAPTERRALFVSVTGVVQGVGFRPFVHRLAARHGLDGWVCNDADAVRIALEGRPDDLDGFLRRLATDAPPLARIDRVETAPAPWRGLGAFHIAESPAATGRRQPVPADVATCEACERELADPANRRHHYPFITCTDCGPRYSVVEAMPYDRERTSMRAFAQCAECRREYATPGDRRYHSETNSCPACGPRLTFVPAGDGPVAAGTDADPLDAAARALRDGAIVAVRGVGGFHLAADATSEPVVAALRRRKRRDAKPLAIMVRTLDDARALATVSDAEAAQLQAPERPIVLLRRHADAPLAPSVAPGLDTVGIMLPYTPLHHLLLARTGRPLVMTSGNLADEPLCAGNDEARSRLAGIADAFLLHDREIVARVDDSVLRLAGSRTVFLRRARGYAPLPLALPVGSPSPLLALGPHLKCTLTLVHGDRAYVSPHVGDMDTMEALEHYRAILERMGRLFGIEPTVAVRDLHPGYATTRLAGELGLSREIAVQHHHAHVAAVLAEHGERGPAVGIAYDGTGCGDDGRVWGAEVLVADLAGYRRAAQLRYAPLPGGDAAARAPWRAALGYMSLDDAAAPEIGPALGTIPAAERRVAERQCRLGVNAPLASSMGRLFDAAAAVLGVCTHSRYEADAAMRLESLAGDRVAHRLPFPFADEGGRLVLDPLPLLSALAERRRAGADVRDLAAAFHESVAASSAALAARVCADAGLKTVVLGGGVFQNARLLRSLRNRLTTRGLRVLAPRLLPPGDGGVSYGQAAIAAACLAAGA